MPHQTCGQWRWKGMWFSIYTLFYFIPQFSCYITNIFSFSFYAFFEFVLLIFYLICSPSLPVYKIGNAADSLSTVTFKLILRGQTAECGNIVEAEMLARKALRILQRIHGSRWKTLNALTTLSQILLFKGNCNTERQELLEQILTIDTQTDGVNSRNVAIANGSLAAHHHNVFLELPKSDANYEKNKKKAAKYCKEAIRISTKVVGSTHRETISYKKTLSEILGKTKLVAWEIPVMFHCRLVKHVLTNFLLYMHYKWPLFMIIIYWIWSYY